MSENVTLPGNPEAERNIVLPGNPEAERAVLGACILSPGSLTEVIGMLHPDDFTEDRNRTLFSVLTRMYAEDKSVDYITISDELESRNFIQTIGGQSYIDELVSNVTVTANIKYHAEIVRDRSIRRKLIATGEHITKLAYDHDMSTQSIFDSAEKMLLGARENRIANEFRHVSEFIRPVFVDIEENMSKTGAKFFGYLTGYMDLDSMTGGLQPGSLNIIAARPSMGKTALAMNIAQFGGGKENAPVLIFSLEMPAKQLVVRMLSAESEVDVSCLLRGMIDSADFDRVREACDIVAKRNIYISDATMLSAMEFRSKCRRFKMRYPELALVVVDYLQLMSSGEQSARTNSRQQEVADISRMLKATAREINCPVLALSQLSRESERRTDKKPQLSDLRDSGAIEQDADLVMLLYREDYYTMPNDNDDDDNNHSPKDSRADIRIAKNRNGSTGVFYLTFRKESTRFYNFGEID